MHTPSSLARLRTRWAAIGAAVAVTLGAGTIATVGAVQSSGERLTYVASDACRLIDTRPDSRFNVGPRNTPLGPAGSMTVAARGAQGQCSAAQLPTDAAALALNVTVTSATADGFLTIWSGGTRPNASSLNPSPGQPPTPNAVTTPLSSGGSFDIYNENGDTHVIVDVVGYYVDHNHDDRYQPAPLDVIDLVAGDFSAAAGEGVFVIGSGCGSTTLPVAAGRTISQITLFYNAPSARVLSVLVSSVELAENADVDNVRTRHFVRAANIPGAANGDEVKSFTLTHDPTFPPSSPSGPARPLGATQATLQLCVNESTVEFIGVRVELTAP